MPADSIELICLRANAPQFDPAKGAEGLPQRILVLPWGEHETTQGKVICNDTTMRQLSAFNSAKGWDRTALDFEHSSVQGSPTYKGEPVKVAGYGQLQLVPNEGVYLLMSSWTNEGKEFAAGGHYGDLSPAVKVNAQNEVIGLHSAALCRHGATPGLVFLSATQAGQTAPMPQGKGKPKPGAKPNPSSSSKSMTPEELIAALCKALGLAADTAPADILTALTTKLAADETEETVKGDMKALSAGLGDLKTLIKAQGDKIDAQADQLKLLSTSAADNETSTILKEAAAAGKVVPAIAAKNLKPADLRLLCAELPVTVPLELRTPDAKTLLLSASTSQPANTELAAIDKLTGVSDDDVKKYMPR